MRKLRFFALTFWCLVLGAWSLHAQITNGGSIITPGPSNTNLIGSFPADAQAALSQFYGLLPQGTNYLTARLGFHTGATLHNGQLENFIGAHYNYVSAGNTNQLGYFSGFDLENAPSNPVVDAFEFKPIGLRFAGLNYEYGAYPLFKHTWATSSGFHPGNQGGLGLFASSHLLNQLPNINGFISLDFLTDQTLPLKRPPTMQVKLGVKLLAF